MRDADRPFARLTRRAVALIAVALLACASLAINAPGAFADFTHGPVSLEFGQNGKPTSTFGSATSVAYDQKNQRLYVLGHEAINAFSNPSPGVLTPLPAPFPLLEQYSGDLAVDNTNNPTAGNFYRSPGYFLLGWDSAGVSLSAFQGQAFATGGYNHGISIDNQGQFFMGQESPEQTVGVWGPEGGNQSNVISTSASVKQVEDVAIDPSNDDLWVSSQYYPTVAHYTEASGYTSFTELPGVLGRSALAINAARHVIYVAFTGFGAEENYGTIKAYSTVTGELLDTFRLPGEFPYIRDIAVQESTDTLFVAVGGMVKELRAIPVPKPTTGEPISDTTVSGTADPDGTGAITECFFEFGPTSSYGSIQACDQAPPLTVSTPVTATLPGLTVESTYHYRLVLGNANGKKAGADRTITPHNVKGLRTDPAFGLTRTAATLEGHYEGIGKETHFHFEWGLTEAPYEHSTPDEIKPAGSGTTPLHFDISGLSAGTTYHYRVVASNEPGSSTAQDVTFTTPPAIKGLTTDAATEITTSTAKLQGTLDPDSLATTYYFQYGHSTDYGLTVPASPSLPVGSTTPVPTQVGTEVTGLEPGSLYHYRIIAVNIFGTTVATDDRTFSTAQAPSVTSFNSRNVTADSAELAANINPNEAATTYRFEYGTTLDYGSVAPVPDGTLAAGSAEKAVSVPLTGLEAATYHFRVVAESKWGTTRTGDQTFNFFPAECPNAHLREQTGSSYLPDCRAYEMVSPVSAGNVKLQPNAPLAPGASSPARFAFSGTLSGIEDAGEVSVNLSDLYVATRSPNGWITKYVGIPATMATSSSGPPNESTFDPATIRASGDLSRLLVWNPGNVFGNYASTLGSYAPYIRTAEGGGLGRLPTNVGEFPGADLDVTEGGFVGDVEVSNDFSHFVFSSRNIAFAPGGLTSAPGSVYDNNVATGAVRVISETPQGTPIPQDVGGGEEYIEIPGVSADGSHVLMSTKGPNGGTHLYMTVDDTAHYDVSEGQDGLNHAVKYVGMTEDGSTVYFTSTERLTADDHDNSTDIFMWKDGSPASVTRVSTGSGGAGDTDACQVTWTTGCSATPVSTGVRSDNAIAAQSGEIYFYSPELLDGSRGTLGDRNLYVFAGGQVRFVATLPGSSLVNRIQVSPDGAHMALITRAKLSSSQTGGHAEMYAFNRGSGGFLCVSCPINGETPAHDAEGSQNGLFMSDDGRTFFSTVDALVPQDTDGLRDSYEFVDSRPQLLTTGTADRTEGTGFVGVSSDGVDAYFSTLETLVPQDTVGPFLKFYDARSGGGIPFQRTAAPCAAADECHGAEPAAPAKLPSTTGAALGTGGNLGSGAKSHRKKKKKSKKSQHRSRQHSKHHHRPTRRAEAKGAQHG